MKGLGYRTKLNSYFSICLLLVSIFLLLYLLVGRDCSKRTRLVTVKNSLNDGDFAGQIQTKISEPTRTPYTLYGEGCPENPYKPRFKVLLQAWQDIAARQNITEYFICFGSMLGWVRNGDAVPYDHDLDLCMFRKDLWRLDSEEVKRPFNYDDGIPHMIIQRHCHHPPSDTPRLDCDGNVVTSYVDKCAIVDPCARILLGSPPFLDVFAIKDNGKELYDEYKRVVHKREVILPLRRCKFMGIETQCLHNSSAYLERYYGENFHIPLKVCRDGMWV